MIKVRKSCQDKRLEVLVIGITTLEKKIHIHPAMLAIADGKALFLGREESYALAAENDICIFAW